MLSDITALQSPGTKGITIPAPETHGRLLFALPRLAAGRSLAQLAIAGIIPLVLALFLAWPVLLLLVAAVMLPVLAWLVISGMKIVEKDLQYY